MVRLTWRRRLGARTEYIALHTQSLFARWYLFESWNSLNSVQAWLFKFCIIWHFSIQPS